jgi:hypothetical protein
MQAAQQILDTHWDGMLPVDPRALATRLGIEVIDGPATPQPCRTDLVAGTHFRVTLDSTRADTATRFALAHALGHVVLEDVNDLSPSHVEEASNFSTGAVFLERRANEFALALLVPARLLHFAVGQPGGQTLRTLSELFGVSEVAMARRLALLGIAR